MGVNTKEIKEQIKSIEGIFKIARTMQNVAASKVKHAERQRAASQNYAQRITEILQHLGRLPEAVQNPYLRSSPTQPQHLGVILLGSDRGLCGSLNNALFRLVEQRIAHYQQQQITLSWDALGGRALLFCQQHQLSVIAQLPQLNGYPTRKLLSPNLRTMLAAYHTGQLDGLLIAHNRFVNHLVRTPVIEPLLPLQLGEHLSSALASGVPSSLSSPSVPCQPYLFEPDIKTSINYLAVKYLETMVYQAVVDNIACEQVARMMAMRSAADNATTLIQDLTQTYHKERQLAITNELADIIGGAEGLMV